VPALALVTTLGLFSTGYVASHGMLVGALRLVSSAEGAPSSLSPDPEPSGTTAAAESDAPATVVPRTSSSAPTPSLATAKASGPPATVAAVGKGTRLVRAAGVVPVPGPPGPPAPPVYPWQTSLWATATAGSSQPCLPPYGPGAHPPMTLTTTTSSAVASWTHNGDAAVVAYWLGWHMDAGTLAQRKAPIAWLKVTPPTGCALVTATLPSLTSGHYRLWMEMDISTPELAGTTASRVGLSSTSFDIP
jgi:hypothetical protein